MYLPSILLLVPMILATRKEVQINSTQVGKLENTRWSSVNVKDIEVIGNRSEELNLSGFRIDNVTKDAFKNVSHIRVLNLFNNSLYKLHKAPFASLTNLEHLNLSYNRINEMRRPFLYLSNLKELDLANNQLKRLRESDSFGLSTSCVILLQHNNIRTMSTELFEYQSCLKHNPVDVKTNNKRDVSLPSNQAIKICTYVVELENTRWSSVNVKDIEVIGDRSEELNLSGFRIRNVAKDTFKNVSHIRVLNLSNNSLYELHEAPFASLTNLEHLNLSYNCINVMRRPFLYLSNFKELDLSNNQLKRLKESDFFGLSTLCVILLQHNNIRTMSTELFEYKSCPSHNPVDAKTDNKRDVSLPSNQPIKICINYAQLISVEHYTEGEKLSSGCSTVINYAHSFLSLNSLGIAKFQEGWYKLADSVSYDIHLSSNYITHLTSTIFNDLPASVHGVYLTFNKIERLEKDTIANEHLRFIDFRSNSIIEIEDDVFINTNLENLNLLSNKLTDTKFALTLPRTLLVLILDSNKIVEIFPESFSKLTKLNSLSLESNYITAIRRDSLRGLSNLKSLSFANNKIQKIEAGSFQDLTKLFHFKLDLNELHTLDSSVFNGLRTLEYLYLDKSNITRIMKGAFDNLESLCDLSLSGNPIKKLENGTLHGLVPKERCKVYLRNVPIEMIHGGLFARRNDSSSDCLSKSRNTQLNA